MKIIDWIRDNPVLGMLPAATMSILQFLTSVFNALASSGGDIQQLCKLTTASSGLETAFLVGLMWLLKAKKSAE